MFFKQEFTCVCSIDTHPLTNLSREPVEGREGAYLLGYAGG